MAAVVPNERLVCVICGNAAFGFNYGIISCNACKMFYRRSDDSLLQEVCRKEGRCYEEENLPMEGRYCRACRYRKCIERNMQRQPVEEDAENGGNMRNDERRVRNGRNDDDGDGAANENIVANIVANVAQEHLEIAHQILDPEVLAGIPKPFVTRNLLDSLLLQELMILNETRIEVYSTINICEDPSFADLVRQGPNLGKYKRPQPIKWEETVRKLKPWGSLGTLVIVEMIKTQIFYKELNHQDRIYLLKAGAFKSHHLSIAFDNFMLKKARVLAPTGEEMFPQKLMNLKKWKRKINDLQEEPVKPLQELNFNLNEYLLLNMIMICDPKIPNISPSGQETLYKWQSKYTNILLQTCLQRDPRNGPSRLLHLLEVMTQFKKQIGRTRVILRMLYNEAKCYIPSILRETCDVMELV